MNQKWEHFVKTGTVAAYLSYKASAGDDSAHDRSGENCHGKTDSDRYGDVGGAYRGI